MTTRTTLLCWLLLLLPRPGSAAPAEAERLARLSRALQAYKDAVPTPGLSAVVVQDGQIVLARGFGVEVAGQPAAMTERSSVGIGSLGKSFTALAILQLVEAGALGLDDPVVRYLPWFRTADRERSDRITLRMLLSNSSGLPSQDAPWMLDADSSPAALERGVRALSRYRMRRAPGESFEYCNEGWGVLALLIEQRSGERYGDYLRRHIFEPAGMQRATSLVEAFESLGVLRGHAPDLDRAFPARPPYQAVAAGAGSLLHASALDLGRYLIALLEGTPRLLSDAGVTQLWTPQVQLPGLSVDDGGDGQPLHYALGWMVDSIDGRQVVYHAGDNLYMSSIAMLEPATRSGVVLLMNSGDLDRYRFPSKYSLANNLLHLLHGRPVSRFGTPRRQDPTRNDYELPEALRARYAGLYLDEAGARLQLQEQPDGLHASLTAGGHQARFLLDFASPGSVVLRNIRGTHHGEFQLTAEGQPLALQVQGLAAQGFFHRLPAQAAGRFRELVSPDGELRGRLPRDWEVDWNGQSFVARSATWQGARIQGGWADQDLDDRCQALGCAGAAVARHEETIAGRPWSQAVWPAPADPSAPARVDLATRVGARLYRVELLATPTQRTHLLREAVLPLLRELEWAGGG